MLESEFKVYTIARIKDRFRDLDLDFIEPKSTTRSLPDVIVLGPGVWAALELKRSIPASKQPNQQWNVDRLNEKGYAAFVYPENLEEVLNELDRLFRS